MYEIIALVPGHAGDDDAVAATSPVMIDRGLRRRDDGVAHCALPAPRLFATIGADVRRLVRRH